MIHTKLPKIGNYVEERFVLPRPVALELRNAAEPFETQFAEFVYFRTYSRIMADGSQEQWADTVIRVIEGVMSIRKQHYYNNNIHWSKSHWTDMATRMAWSMFHMRWLPPGRGLWAMGTDYVYQRGAMSLYNCAFTEFGGRETLANDVEWFMDSLMNGVGVGFTPVRDNTRVFIKEPTKGDLEVIIGDDREGWAHSQRLLIESYLDTRSDAWGHTLRFNYDDIRPEGEPINGFGGTASGPEPLRDLHEATRILCENLANQETDVVEFKTDLANLIGCCVVAGNIRRSAEMALAPMSDPVFKNLKDYEAYPDRKSIGWMSNNSVILRSAEDFEGIHEIAERVVRGEDLGYFNAVNVVKGRLGHDDGLEEDIAMGLNPCGEIPLENKEVCNLSETLPTRCKHSNDWLRGCRYASLYSSTVSLLPTHQRDTNAMIMKNRRIGVSIIDMSGWKHTRGVAKVIRDMRRGYDVVRQTNHEYNSQAGVPDAIRVTTMKPGGTVPKIASRTAGLGYPTFRETLMRVRVAHRHSIFQVLGAANVPHELDVYDLSKSTECFEFPVLQGPAKPALEASLWEQAMNLVLVQMEWADNAVSNTLYFRPMWQKVHSRSDIDRAWVEREISAEKLDEPGDTILNAWQDVADEEEAYSCATIPGRCKIEFKWNTQHDCVDVVVWEFDPKHEEDDVEPVLAHIAPLTKSVALLPHSNEGAYAQMPQEGISKEHYEYRLTQIKLINWSEFRDSDGHDEKFCEGDRCELGGGNEVIDS